MPTTGFHVAFDETIDQGDGADGMTFIFADPTTGPTALGAVGGGLGYSGLAGVAVTFDTFQNGPDPSSNFMGITTSGLNDNMDYVVTTTSIPALRNATRHVVISYAGGVLTVTYAGTVVLSTPVTLPSNAYIGWTAGTGGNTDRHMVTNVTF